MSYRDGDQKRANQLFRELMDQSKTHVRLGATRRDSTAVRIIGAGTDLHGPAGVCACCHGRTLPAGTCTACYRSMNRRLAALGDTTHPTCVAPIDDGAARTTTIRGKA